jgi:hypothetical protein
MSEATTPNSPDHWQQLLALVERRLAIVADREWYQRDPAGHLAGLQKAAADLDASVARLPGDTDPMLRHYLERQSYLKACDWLRDAIKDRATTQ